MSAAEVLIALIASDPPVMSELQVCIIHPLGFHCQASFIYVCGQEGRVKISPFVQVVQRVKYAYR